MQEIGQHDDDMFENGGALTEMWLQMTMGDLIFKTHDVKIAVPYVALMRKDRRITWCIHDMLALVKPRHCVFACWPSASHGACMPCLPS